MSAFMDFFQEIAEMAPYYRFANLIETGIGTDLPHGGLAVADLLSLRAYSCDIEEARCDAARQRFPASLIYHGESTDFLREKLPLIHGPSFVWLDAHHAQFGNIWPLYEELQLLRGREHDVIWCDDIQHIADPANPAHPKGQRVAFTYEDGREWIGDTTHPIAEYIKCLEETHDAAISGTVLKFSPKRGA